MRLLAQPRYASILPLFLGLILLAGASLAAAADDNPAAKTAKSANQNRPADDTAGVLPIGENGKPLNLDFETGTLSDWTAEGNAFKDQPVQGDIPDGPKARDKKAEPQGKFWIGTYERAGDAPRGTLTSVPFKITHPFATFLVGGGAYAETRVEIVRKDSGRVVFAASGRDMENMRRVGVDLREHQGKEIFIRLVDQHTGGWGHINFDDFRFHRVLPPLPKEPSVLVPDQYPYAGLSPEKAAEVMTVPEGFQVKLFAGEPDVHQPIAMAIDDRGRLWIAEAYEYPRRALEGKGHDRILIFEDTDGDGHFDKSKVFIEGLNLVSGLEVGFGGVFVGAAPYLMFIPDKNGDDIPDGPSMKAEPQPGVAFPKDVPPGAQVLLDGWAYQDTHETLNAFIWGPDGWLYGCHGVFTYSNVGKPGTPKDQRTPINAGIWRYHPVRHEFEVFAEGTSNPWGVDFNDYGHAFATACVIPHLYHIIQGGRYQRQAGEHFNPYTYDDIKTIADHVHYLGPNPHGGNSKSDSAGGGHAHAGAMIYLGGKWPEKYRGQIFMNNIHGQRINMDILEPRGSGYVGHHGPDFLLSNDQWSQIVNLRYGPDGDVYMIDWYDKNACHNPDANVHDRTNGRIFKVIYGQPEKVEVDLKKLSDLELAKLVENKNDWYVRHSRRILQERAADGRASRSVVQFLQSVLLNHPDPTRRIRALWALHSLGQSQQSTQQTRKDEDANVRAWNIQLAFENVARNEREDSPRRFINWGSVAGDGALKTPAERLYAAAALQRSNPSFPFYSRVLGELLDYPEDIADHNLALMYWYALEPAIASDPRGLDLAIESHSPLLLEFAVRRMVDTKLYRRIDGPLEALGKVKSNRQRLAILKGLSKAFQGQRRVDISEITNHFWSRAYEDLKNSENREVASQVRSLALKFGDESALGELRDLIRNSGVDVRQRTSAIEALVAYRDKPTLPVLRAIVGERADDSIVLRASALRALAAYDDSQTPPVIINAYPTLTQAEKRDALATLTSRKSYAAALLDAIGNEKLPSSDLPADLARQIKNLKDEKLTERLSEVWGSVADQSADAKTQIARWTAILTNKPPRPEDASHGRAIFTKTCAQCHTLFGEGGKVGPDLTGSNRANLDYLLGNVLEPSAIMAKEYQTSTITLADGRVITGIIKAQDKKTVTVQTPNELLTYARSDIDDIQTSPISMMPVELLKPLSEDDVRALVAYLASPKQVALASPEPQSHEDTGKRAGR